MLLLIVLRIRPAGNVISAPAPRNITLVIRPVDQLVPFYLHLPLFPFLSLSFFLCQIAVFHILYATKTLSTYQESVIYICQQQTVWGTLSMRCTGGVWKLPSCSQLQLLLRKDAVINSAQSGGHSGKELPRRPNGIYSMFSLVRAACLLPT